MQTASSRVWTRITGFIFNDDNHYTVGATVRENDVSQVLRWISTHGDTSVYQKGKTYIIQFSEDSVRRLEDLPGAMDTAGEWWERQNAQCNSRT